jgi:hypothetical protein
MPGFPQDLANVVAGYTHGQYDGDDRLIRVSCHFPGSSSPYDMFSSTGSPRMEVTAATTVKSFIGRLYHMYRDLGHPFVHKRGFRRHMNLHNGIDIGPHRRSRLEYASMGDILKLCATGWPENLAVIMRYGPH